MHALPYAGDSATTKIVTENLPPARGEFAAACLLACWPLFFLGLSRAFFGIIICAVITLAMARLARKLIGGQRGDVLGAIEQLCEVGFLLACAAKFSP
jgi:adenosylcobinamide-GDP ribazoletransferase